MGLDRIDQQKQLHVYLNTQSWIRLKINHKLM